MSRLARVLGGAVVASMLLVLTPTWAAEEVRVPETLSYRVPATAGPVVPGFPIDHVGVLWDDPGHRSDARAHHGAVRFRHDGVWGDWVPLVKDGAPGNGLWASGLVAGDGAQAFQVRGIPAGAGSPRTVAFNTSDGPLRTTGLRVGGAAALSRCRSRAEWGADESLRERVRADFAPAQVMTLHHTATSNGAVDPAGTVRAIYAYHTVDNGWRDIGYHYLISEDGTVFEGRWSGTLGKDAADDTYSQACATGGTGADFAHESSDDAAALVVGAHAGGYNTGNVGVALLGSFSDGGTYDGVPTPAAVAAAEGVLAEFAGRHGIDPLGTVDYANSVNTKPGVDAISGHRDYNATECPGDNLYSLLPQIRSAVATLLEPAVDPSPPGARTMHVADLDGVASSQRRSWQAEVTIAVRDASGESVSSAVVTGDWGGDASTCETDDAGTCSVTSATMSKKTTAITFSVTAVAADSLTYEPADNTDPDHDSDGTTIQVVKP